MKKINSKRTVIGKYVLGSLVAAKPNWVLRSTLRKIHDIDPNAGETHPVFDDYVAKGLIEEREGVSTGGKPPKEHRITEKGEGYYQAMIDYGIV